MESMFTFAPGRAFGAPFEPLKTRHGSFGDMISRKQGGKVNKVDDHHHNSNGESNATRFTVQPRTAFKQQVNPFTQTIADKSSSEFKPTPATTSTAVASISMHSSVWAKPSVTARANLKRSADHLETSNAPLSKRHASHIIKKEPGSESGSSTPIKTIREQVEDLLQSTRSSPTLPPKKHDPDKREYGRAHGLGITHHASHAPTPSPRPEVTNHVSAESNAMTPGIPSDMIRPNIGYYGQRFGNLQLGSFPPQTLPQTPPALDIDAFSAAPHAQQKQMIGEILYPKVYTQQPKIAGKITRMLLELDNAELIDLISDEPALRHRIERAMGVYNDYVEANHGKDV
ncbi:Polyadenylate-binding protein/Hyperplastic disc protein [Aureobasidium namibiae CBS 147.97]|uniref:Polyadenylate-binding protein/Hyperplastic disc protein n=1 Tax=Aureobasidium namibiae CBS 147.97 TaxID=1043004 RepID=A0A074WMX7_9PEZI|nr:Polyadenylate-binding protein/Hyperplastic disc protein [Aureobasidium namibiae CBS 147.97]KEQ74455.1 Polyadenylate-binding protein/Hyperplastic disc protein [Aureobasidium namibiae CBS 147.97]